MCSAPAQLGAPVPAGRPGAGGGAAPAVLDAGAAAPGALIAGAAPAPGRAASGSGAQQGEQGTVSGCPAALLCRACVVNSRHRCGEQAKLLRNVLHALSLSAARQVMQHQVYGSCCGSCSDGGTQPHLRRKSTGDLPLAGGGPLSARLENSTLCMANSREATAHGSEIEQHHTSQVQLCSSSSCWQRDVLHAAHCSAGARTQCHPAVQPDSAMQRSLTQPLKPLSFLTASSASRMSCTAAHTQV
jgi:hypothetical protein